jgi:hypothetical protein
MALTRSAPFQNLLFSKDGWRDGQPVGHSLLFWSGRMLRPARQPNGAIPPMRRVRGDIEMLKSIVVALALASGLAVSSAALSPANAVTIAKPHSTAGTSVTHVSHRRHHGGVHFRRHHFYGGPVVIHRSYGNGCYWLKRRALNTGSRYWWHRYQECRYR